MQSLATMEHTEVGRILLHAVSVEAQKRDRMLKRNPRYEAQNIREDIRYTLGELDGLAFLGKLHAAARKAVGIKDETEEDQE